MDSPKIHVVTFFAVMVDISELTSEGGLIELLYADDLVNYGTQK